MKASYEKPQVYSFDAELNILYTACSANVGKFRWYCDSCTCKYGCRLTGYPSGKDDCCKP